MWRYIVQTSGNRRKGRAARPLVLCIVADRLIPDLYVETPSAEQTATFVAEICSVGGVFCFFLVRVIPYIEFSNCLIIFFEKILKNFFKPLIR